MRWMAVDTIDECGCFWGARLSLDRHCIECGKGLVCNGLGEVSVMGRIFRALVRRRRRWEVVTELKDAALVAIQARALRIG